MLWLASVSYRNRGNPRVHNVTWETEGGQCQVACQIWNPQTQPVQVRTTIRLISLGGEETALGPSIGRESVFHYQIDARSSLEIKETVPAFPSGEPEVRAFLVLDSEDTTNQTTSSPS